MPPLTTFSLELLLPLAVLVAESYGVASSCIGVIARRGELFVVLAYIERFLARGSSMSGIEAVVTKRT